MLLPLVGRLCRPPPFSLLVPSFSVPSSRGTGWAIMDKSEKGEMLLSLLQGFVMLVIIGVAYLRNSSRSVCVHDGRKWLP